MIPKRVFEFDVRPHWGGTLLWHIFVYSRDKGEWRKRRKVELSNNSFQIDEKRYKIIPNMHSTSTKNDTKSQLWTYFGFGIHFWTCFLRLLPSSSSSFLPVPFILKYMPQKSATPWDVSDTSVCTCVTYHINTIQKLRWNCFGGWRFVCWLCRSELSLFYFNYFRTMPTHARAISMLLSHNSIFLYLNETWLIYYMF